MFNDDLTAQKLNINKKNNENATHDMTIFF